MTTSPPGCVFYSSFPTIHMRGSTASSQSLLRRKRLTVVSRITNKCLLESVTVTQLLKQFPITRLIFSHRPPTPLRSAPTRELPACRAYHVRHETNRKVPGPRLPPFTAVGWHTPRRSLSITTQTHTPPTRTSPGLGRGSCLSVRFLLGFWAETWSSVLS